MPFKILYICLSKYLILQNSNIIMPRRPPSAANDKYHLIKGIYAEFITLPQLFALAPVAFPSESNSKVIVQICRSHPSWSCLRISEKNKKLPVVPEGCTFLFKSWWLRLKTMRKEFVLHSQQQLQWFCWNKQQMLARNHKYCSLNFYSV